MNGRFTFLVVLAACTVQAQTTSQANYHSRFENDVVAVYELDLASRTSAPVFEAAHDSFWISLSTSIITFSRQQDKTEVQFEPGDVRFFPSFETKLVTNNGPAEFHGILVSLKPRALISNGCECTGNTGKTICGCKGANHLEALWALGLGDVTLAGTSLAAGEGFRSAASRDDMLLVAVTSLQIRDEASSESGNAQDSALHLNPGEAVWIKGGRHRFRNVGSMTARFVTFEF